MTYIAVILRAIKKWLDMNIYLNNDGYICLTINNNYNPRYGGIKYQLLKQMTRD